MRRSTRGVAPRAYKTISADIKAQRSSIFMKKIGILIYLTLGIVSITSAADSRFTGEKAKNTRIVVPSPSTMFTDESDNWIPFMLQGMFTTNLQNYTEMTVIDRMSVQKVMDEQRLAENVAYSEKDQIEAGRLVSAHFMLSVQIIKASGLYTLDCKIVDLETGEAVGKAYTVSNYLSESLRNGTAVNAATREILLGLGIPSTRLAGLGGAKLSEQFGVSVFVGDTITVSKKGGNFATITDAISAAQEGATINIMPGIYKETLVINKHIKLAGLDVGTVVVEGKDGTICTVTSDAEISNMTFRNSKKHNPIKSDKDSPENGTALVLCTGNARFDGCIFDNAMDYGLQLSGRSTKPVIFNCTIKNAQYHGVKIINGVQPFLDTCSVEQCADGIYISDKGTTAVLNNCTVQRNYKSGIVVDSLAELQAENCTVRINALNGIAFSKQATGTVTACNTSNNGICGIQISDSKTNPSIQSTAVHENGTYGIAVALQASGTITSCDIWGNKKSGIFVTDSGSAPIIQNCSVRSNKKYGVEFKSTGTMKGCDISNNSGVGIVIGEQGSNPSIADCRIYDNKDAGIWITDGAAGNISDCDVFSNTKDNISISSKGTKPTITHCKIHGGLRIGIDVTLGGGATVQDCEIYGNMQWGIRAMDVGTLITLTACSVYGNNMDGILIYGNSKVVIKNCGIFENKLGIDIEGSGNNIIMQECKIHDNSSFGISLQGPFKAQFSDCDVYANNEANVYIRSYEESYHTSSISFVGCNIHNGKAEGIYIDEKGSGSFQDCDIYGNEDWAVFMIDSENVNFSSCTIHDNINTSIALAGKKTKPVFSKCKIYDGHKSAIYIAQEASGNFVHCDIYGNAWRDVEIEGPVSNAEFDSCKIYDGGEQGVLVHSGGNVILRSCEIFTSSYNSNAAVSIEDGSSTLNVIHSRIHGYTVGIFAQRNANCTIQNSGVYENGVCEILIRNSTANIQYCEIYNHSFNETSAIVFDTNATGSVKDCQFRKNAIYALFVENGSSVHASGNKGL